ncbi:hypothetical protein [Enterobacter phage ST22]|nr:hypothetical protein [Enterobacter phage ST22]
MRKTIVAVTIALASITGVAHAGAGVDLYNTIQNMSYQDAARTYSGFDAQQQAEFDSADKAAGTNWRQDLHAGGVTTPHLDGNHQQPVTPHADAPAGIDRSSHLDSNVTDAQRQQAKLDAAIQHAIQVHDGKDGLNGKDGKDGVNGHDGVDGKNGTAGANGHDGAAGRDGVNGVDGHNGLNGKDGAAGKAGRDGVNGKDGKAGRDGKAGAAGKDGKDGQAGAKGEKGEKGDKGDTGAAGRDFTPRDTVTHKELARATSAAIAAAGLHYDHGNGAAVAIGSWDNSAALAVGAQYQATESTAVTLDLTTDGHTVGGAVGAHVAF